MGAGYYSFNFPRAKHGQPGGKRKYSKFLIVKKKEREGCGRKFFLLFLSF